MADVTINELTSQAPTTSDLFPFSTAVSPSTYKASLAQIKTALAIPTAVSQLTNDSAYITANNTGVAKAWVNFDGTTGATVAGEFRCTIRSAHNVSKVVRNTTGDYSVYFNVVFADADYCAIVSSGRPYQVVPHAEAYSASAFGFKNNYIVNNNGNTLENSAYFNVVIFR
jgi:hypothetical protein